MPRTYGKMSLEASLYARFLYHEKGMRGQDLVKALQANGFPPVAYNTVRMHAKKPLNEKHVDRRKSNPGHITTRGVLELNWAPGTQK